MHHSFTFLTIYLFVHLGETRYFSANQERNDILDEKLFEEVNSPDVTPEVPVVPVLPNVAVEVVTVSTTTAASSDDIPTPTTMLKSHLSRVLPTEAAHTSSTNTPVTSTAFEVTVPPAEDPNYSIPRMETLVPIHVMNSVSGSERADLEFLAQQAIRAEYSRLRSEGKLSSTVEEKFLQANQFLIPVAERKGEVVVDKENSLETTVSTTSEPDVLTTTVTVAVNSREVVEPVIATDHGREVKAEQIKETEEKKTTEFIEEDVEKAPITDETVQNANESSINELPIVEHPKELDVSSRESNLDEMPSVDELEKVKNNFNDIDNILSKHGKPGGLETSDNEVEEVVLPTEGGENNVNLTVDVPPTVTTEKEEITVVEPTEPETETPFEETAVPTIAETTPNPPTLTTTTVPQPPVNQRERDRFHWERTSEKEDYGKNIDYDDLEEIMQSAGKALIPATTVVTVTTTEESTTRKPVEVTLSELQQSSELVEWLLHVMFLLPRPRPTLFERIMSGIHCSLRDCRRAMPYRTTTPRPLVDSDSFIIRRAIDDSMQERHNREESMGIEERADDQTRIVTLRRCTCFAGFEAVETTSSRAKSASPAT